MSDTPNIRAVQGFLAAQYDGDFDTAFGEFAQPDFSWVVSTRDEPALRAAIPWAGYRLEGEAGYRELMDKLFGEFEALEFNPERFTDAGDRVYVEGRFVFRHRTTGKTAVSDYLARFDMREERIAGGQFYENTESIAAARRPG